jgi:hypothetical protein
MGRWLTVDELRAECAQRIKSRRLQAKQRIRDTRNSPGDEYAGDNPDLCNAHTKAGHPCRSLALANGRCKWHVDGPEDSGGHGLERDFGKERANDKAIC